MIHNPALLPKVRSEALTRACQHMPCALRIASFVPGHTCSGDDTVVGAHLPVFGKGTGTKVSDLFIVAACWQCHEILDGRDKRAHDYIAYHYPTAMLQRMLNGLAETQSRFVMLSLLTAANMEVIQ
jgi:hypothetical protein